MKKRIAIIGAGPAGLVSAKSCLEAGMEPVIFEKSSQIGGIWGEGSTAWDGMHTNLSRWSCMFSDFPWDNMVQTFPTQREVLDYLNAYADHFDLRPYLQLDFEVKNVFRNGCKWDVRGTRQISNYDGVIVASGFFSRPVLPDLEFDGEIIHSSQCSRDTFSNHGNKRVMVLGGSFSGYELASEFARVSYHPVYHQFRHPVWILKRHFMNASRQPVPNDILSYIRGMRDIGLSLNSVEKNSRRIGFLKAQFGNPGDVHEDLKVNECPNNPIFAAISDDYLDLVKAGKIIPVRSENFDGKDAGLLVCATGYAASLPYLSDAVKYALDFSKDNCFMPLILHDTVWPNDVKGLAFVGMYRGPFFAVMELQARWAAGVMAGEIPAPSQTEIFAGVKAAHALRNTWPQPQFPYADYIGLADKLAGHVGCMPDIFPQEAFYDLLYNQAVMPWHYRLKGRHANKDMAQKIAQQNPFLK